MTEPNSPVGRGVASGQNTGLYEVDHLGCSGWEEPLSSLQPKERSAI